MKVSAAASSYLMQVFYVQIINYSLFLLEEYNLRLRPYRDLLPRAANLSLDVFNKHTKFWGCCWCVSIRVHSPQGPCFSVCLSFSSCPITQWSQCQDHPGCSKIDSWILLYFPSDVWIHQNGYVSARFIDIRQLSIM